MKGDIGMGLIKAVAGAVGGTMADQWKEFFYCEAMDKNVMVRKGQKQTSSRSSNTKGNDNIITNGSGHLQSQVFSPVILEIVFRRHLQQSENDLHLVAIQVKISVFIILIQKS